MARSLAVLRDEAADASQRCQIEALLAAAGLQIVAERQAERGAGLVAAGSVLLVVDGSDAVAALAQVAREWRSANTSAAFQASSDSGIVEQQISVLFRDTLPAPFALPDDVCSDMSTRPPAPAQSMELSPTSGGHSDASPPPSGLPSPSAGVSDPIKAATPPTPQSHSIVSPRPTRASALRTGEELPERPKAERRTSSSTLERAAAYHRTAPVEVASTRSPIVAPRQTKASALRAGAKEGTLPTPTKARQALTTAERAAAERASHGSPAPSTPRPARTPSIAPRENKASTFRIAGDSAGPSTPTQPRQALTTAQRSAAERAKRQSMQTIEVASTRSPVAAPRLNKAAALRTGSGSSVGAAVKGNDENSGGKDTGKQTGMEAGPKSLGPPKKAGTLQATSASLQSKTPPADVTSF